MNRFGRSTQGSSAIRTQGRFTQGSNALVRTPEQFGEELSTVLRGVNPELSMFHSEGEEYVVLSDAIEDEVGEVTIRLSQSDVELEWFQDDDGGQLAYDTCTPDPVLDHVKTKKFLYTDLVTLAQYIDVLCK